MTEYDGTPRKLTWPLLHPLVGSVTVEEDGDCSPSSFVWPTDPNERTLIPFYLSLNEYNILGSAIDVGSDIAFGDDALRVVWLWMRNFRCDVSICDAILACVQTNMGLQEAIAEMLIQNPAFVQTIGELIVQENPPIGNTGNVYPPLPNDVNVICNAAKYIADQMRDLIERIFDDLATTDPLEVFGALLGQNGWYAEALYNLIEAVVPEVANKAAILATYDANIADLQCELEKSTLSQASVVAWIAETFAANPVFANILARAVTSTSEQGRWLQWIAVGSLNDDAVDCGCSPEPNIRLVSIGFPEEAIELIAVDGLVDEYDLKTYFSGHYLTGGAQSLGLVPFYIRDVQFDPDLVGHDARFVLDFGTFKLDEVPCDVATSKIWIYNAIAGQEVKVFISPDPCAGGVWEIDYYGEIISQTADEVVAEGRLTFDSGGLYQLELIMPYPTCVTIDSGTATLTTFEYLRYYPCEDDGVHFLMDGYNFPPITGLVRGFSFSSPVAFQVTINYTQ